MARNPRLLAPLAAAGVLAAFAAPASATNPQAPGVLKKQETTSATTPAPAATTPAQAPQVQTQTQSPAPAQHTKTTGNVPVNKGTTKKLLRSQPVVTSAPAAVPVTRARTHVTNRRAARRSARRHVAVARSQAAVHARGGSVHPGASTGGHGVRTRAGAVSGGAAAAAAAARKAASARAHRTAPRVKATKAVSSAPLAVISRAADTVVQVIPGAVILALAGLATLVLLLIVRSWTMERRRSKALAASYGVTVEALATAIEAKDHTTGGHIERVRRLGLLLAAQIAPREAKDPQMAYGFLLHDIGKLAVPDAILRAPGRLNEDEWALMRRHPDEGVRMLASVPFLDRALDVVRYHHERWDGGGYPQGLRGDEIPLWARIFSVVDALDAMTAERPYRQARSYEAALEEIRRHAGRQFDPAVVDALAELDPALVTPLLEPAQQLEPPLAEVTPIAPLVAA